MATMKIILVSLISFFFLVSIGESIADDHFKGGEHSWKRSEHKSGTIGDHGKGDHGNETTGNW